MQMHMFTSNLALCLHCTNQLAKWTKEMELAVAKRDDQLIFPNTRFRLTIISSAATCSANSASLVQRNGMKVALFEISFICHMIYHISTKEKEIKRVPYQACKRQFANQKFVALLVISYFPQSFDSRPVTSFAPIGVAVFLLLAPVHWKIHKGKMCCPC